MKTIKLLSLKLVNFKGIKEFEFNPAGQNVDVFGDNGIGKTTVADAYTWLLTGKDSKGNTTNNMGIKTKVDGKVIHKMEHSVEGKFSFNGSDVTLKKVFKEVWRKKTGEITENHTGHTTQYFIDDVITKEKDYNEFINTEITNIEKIPMLIDLWHFNEKLNHKSRREELFEVIGGMSDEDIINSDKDLQELPKILESRSVEKHMEKILFEQRNINKRIEEIPILIRENTQNMPDVKESEAELKEKISLLDAKISDKQKEINTVASGTKESELRRQLNELEIELQQVKSQHNREQTEELYKLETRLSEEETNLTLLRNNVKTQMEHKKLNEEFVKSKQEQMQNLREEYQRKQEEYKEQAAKEFDDSNCTCPTCEQDLPQNKIDESIARFNKNKSDLLERIKSEQDSINQKGVALKEEVEQLEIDVEPIDKEIEKITAQGKKKESDIELLKEKVAKAKSEVVPVEENEKYIKLTEQITSLNDEIKSINDNVEERTADIRKAIAELEVEKQSLQIELNKFDERKRTKERNSELEAEEKEIAQAFAELERQKHLLNKFTKTKVSMVEGSINKHFKYVNFKLFEELVNGGLRDICVVTVDGKEFGTENNTAADYNASLDVINALSKHYGVQLPLFVDKSESVTKFIDTDVQLITLNVSKGDTELRVEIDSDSDSEVA